jgi:hypothetical protein
MSFGLQSKDCDDQDLVVRGLGPRDAIEIQQDRPMGGIWPKVSRKASAGAMLRLGSSRPAAPMAAPGGRPQASLSMAFERASGRRRIVGSGRRRRRDTGGQGMVRE